MTVRVMEIINKARVEVERIKKEQLGLDKRLEQFSKRAEAIQDQHKRNLDQLGLSPADLEKQIQKGDLNKEGVEMFITQVSKKGTNPLPKTLKFLEPFLPKQQNQAPEKQEQPSLAKKKRLRIDL
ncbi:MAG: hypothetical protein HUK40_14115 [Desulfobacter sp.]|nr:hypothetical protein [Desulfobacter sp.]